MQLSFIPILQKTRKIGIKLLTIENNEDILSTGRQSSLTTGDVTMLLEFLTANYKSFAEPITFSLEPAPKQKGLDYSVIKTKAGKKTYKALCSAIIYGANAAGKTNIIGAMDTFKAIVLRGNIRNNNGNPNNPNVASDALELIPNNTLQDASPVEFSIKFITQQLLIKYTLIADLGKFSDADHKRKILEETLYVNEELVFSRQESLEFGTFRAIKDYLINDFSTNRESAIAIAKNSLNDEELFLTGGFKTMFSSKLTGIITDWLSNSFMVIYRADSMQTVRQYADPKKKSVYIEKTINDAARYFGINSNALGYVINDDSSNATLFSLFKDAERALAIPAEIFESYGTIRFINLFPLVISALLNGGTLVVDEFDASIHPMALMNIINIFHNDEINVHHAQLVFNTHNPIFLNSNLYRRDEINFVERDEDTHHSSHYTLADFGTSGQGGVRKNEDYMKNYFVNRYGAISNVDFSPIFEEIINGSREG